MIESLTPEQEAATEDYSDKWIKIGLDTRPCDRAKVESLYPALYEMAGKEVPKKFRWYDSPNAAIEALHEEFGFSKNEILSNFCFGNHDANWLGFYEYWHNEVGLTEECKKVIPLIEFGKEAGWYLPYDEMIVFIERPEEIHLIDDNEQLHSFINEKPEYSFTFKDGSKLENSKRVNTVTTHRDGGVAIKYRDGFSIYKLNGVVVPEWLAVTPAEEIDPKKLLKIKNVEVRREFVRKLGIERIIRDCGCEVIDTQDEYELLLFDIGEGNMRPYLKMKNPSIGTYHVEGVHPDCTTVKAALAWRNNSFVTPRILT